jgi:hypothetical protein
MLIVGIVVLSLEARAQTVRRDTLPEVSVRGYKDPGSQRQALRLQKAATIILDIIPEEAIQSSTDMTVADVTRRVNGLSVTTDNSGQTDHTIIRGMDPKYNYTLVNGIKIPSPGDHTRYVPLSIFPADLVQRVEVYKNLTPEMEGDAIGGVVNLVLRNAPEQPLLRVRFASGYNQTFFNQSFLYFDSHVVQPRSPYELHGPDYQATGSDFTKANLSFRNIQPAPDALGSLTWGSRFFAGKAGVLLAADYQNIHRGSPDNFIPQNNEPQPGNQPGLTDFYRNQYYTDLIREGLHSRLDYVFNSRNSIGFYQVYASQQDIESRWRTDTSLSQGRTIPGTGRITISERSRLHLQHLYSASLQGDHQLGSGFDLRWTSAWSVATGLYPDWSELSAGTARIQQPNGEIDQEPLLLQPLTRTWLRNRERDFSNYLYLDYRRKVGDHELLLGTGGLYREKARTSFYNSYYFEPAITAPEGQPFTDIYGAVWTNNNGPQNPLGSASNANTYTAQEYIGAAYALVQWKGKRADWMAGLRYEDTRQQFVSSVDPTVSYGKTGSITYRDYLPSAQLKYRLDEREVLRASWYRSISRPALYDVTFYSIQYEDYEEAGNPFLRRTQADNVDLRWEWYKDLDVVEAGVFYKHLTDPYERTLLDAGDELYPIPQGGLSYTPASELTSQLRNAGDASDYGAELAATKYFGRLGVQVQYTYTWSRIVQPTKYKTRVNPGDPTSDIITVTRNESRPLQGQSPDLASLGLIYKDEYHGWLARVTGIYTGRRIYSVSGWWGLDYWQRGYAIFDASVSKDLGHGFRVFAKADNLFDTRMTVDLLKANPDFASGLVPGQQRADRFTVMQQTIRESYAVGVQWIMH